MSSRGDRQETLSALEPKFVSLECSFIRFSFLLPAHHRHTEKADLCSPMPRSASAFCEHKGETSCVAGCAPKAGGNQGSGRDPAPTVLKATPWETAGQAPMSKLSNT